MTDEANKKDSFFRTAVGVLALGAGIVGFAALFFIEIPGRNENALMFAMGIVFGWGSAVIGSEYGATTTGRKVAESAIRNIERQNGSDITAPQQVEVVNTPSSPVPTTDSPAEPPADEALPEYAR